MLFEQRKSLWDAVEQNPSDVAIVGAGINGACLYHHLCQAGYRVLLIDKGDFAGGTSQASAMMIWGGLLYLRYWDWMTVGRLCGSRDRMIHEMRDWAQTRRFRYLPAQGCGRRRAFVGAALHLYWLLGRCRRARPRSESRYSEQGLLRKDGFDSSLLYEEGFVEPSDARFVCHWIFQPQNGAHVPLSYCRLEGGRYETAARQWYLELTDTLGSRQLVARARLVVNAAGVWTDAVNQRFGLESPYRHVFSKGVFIGLPRHPTHEVPLIFDNREDGDCMSLIPWGPVALWGPTEAAVPDLEEGFQASPAEVYFLLDELNRHLARPVDAANIVSIRCGVRPLVADRPYVGDGRTLHLSRRCCIYKDPKVPWISIYGGKLTGCESVAKWVTKVIGQTVPASDLPVEGGLQRAREPHWECFPGLAEKVPSAMWCAEQEMCYTLEDYLRRRTNISQWVPRRGLGRADANLSHLSTLAKVFCATSGKNEEATLAAYRDETKREFDDAVSEL